jgi:hypothetical protein
MKIRLVNPVMLSVIAWALIALGARLACGQSLTAKAGSITYSSSRTPTTAVKVDTRALTDKSTIIFASQKGGFVFVRVLTDKPIMTPITVDSLTVTAEGDTVMVPVEREVESGQFFERNYQCSWVQFAVVKDAKIARLIDVDGTEHEYPAEKVLAIWKGDTR